MNRFKHNRLIVDVHDFSQRVSIAAFFRSGKAVVAITHSEDNRRRIPIPCICIVCKLLKCLVDSVGRRSGNLPADKMPSSAVELKVIQYRTRLYTVENTVLRIVDKYHNMGHFKRSTASDSDPGRKPFFNSSLRCADWRNGVPAVVIKVKIHQTHKPTPYHTGRKRSLYINITVTDFRKYAVFQIFLHDMMDSFALFFDVLCKIGFRQHHAQRAGSASDKGVKRIPVFRLGRVLVAGNDTPLFHVHRRGRNQDVSSVKYHFVPKIRSPASPRPGTM